MRRVRPKTAGSEIGREVSDTGATITCRNLNVQPTIHAPVGYKFTVQVNKDIFFEAPYEPAGVLAPLVVNSQRKRRNEHCRLRQKTGLNG
jgi:hypothetical protein